MSAVRLRSQTSAATSLAVPLALVALTVLVGATGYLLLTLIVLMISIVGLRIGVRLFQREAILTRWR